MISKMLAFMRCQVVEKDRIANLLIFDTLAQSRSVERQVMMLNFIRKHR